MKRCPECRKDYLDDSLLYCLDDGTPLVQGTVTDEPATAILSGDRRSGEALTESLKTATLTGDNSLTLRLPAFLSRERLPWIMAGVLLIGLVVAVPYAVRNGRAVVTNERIRTTFYIQPPQRRSGFGQIAISPDGRNIVVASDVEGKTVLWLRPMDSLEGRPLAGTDGVVGFPFWSPDSRSIGFWVAENKLKRVDIADGTVRDLGEAPAGAGGAGCAWNRDGTVLCNGRGGFVRLPASGGVSDRLPGYDSKEDELFRWPSFLPDGEHFLFLVTNNDRTKSEVYVGSIDGSTRKLLFAADSNAIYSAKPDGKGGYLLFARGAALLAQAFDLETLSVSGEPFRVAESVRVNFNNRGYFSVSDNGTLVYDPRTDEYEGRQLTWYDRSGKELQAVGKAGPMFRFRLSPDEKLVSMSSRGTGNVNNDILVTDIARGASSRLASFPGDTPESIWSPDGKYVVWNERVGTKIRLMKKLASGAGEAEVLLESEVSGIVPSDWSADGKFILYTSFNNRSRDIWVLPLDGDSKPFPYIQTPSDDQSAVFSPDGKYVAYRSFESGRNEIYIQTFPASATKLPVSTNGGTAPFWARNGRELFYIASGKLMSVEIKPGDPLSVGVPQPLVDFAAVRSPRNDDYAVSNDGQRLLFISRAADATSLPIVAVLNWSAGLNR